MMETNDFDLLRDFDRLAALEDNTAKGELFRYLYHIESVCRNNWQAMPADVQDEIIKTVQAALETVRSLPSNEA